MRLNLPADWHLPALFTHRLGDMAGRQRAMFADGHLLLILHEAPVAGVPARTGRLFWRQPDGHWRSKPLGEGAHALKRHVAEFADRVDALERRWQEAASAADYFELLRAISPLHRAVRHLYTVLQEARELVPHDRDLINVRDQVGEIERALDLLHSDARNGLDFRIAHQTEQQAERTYDMAISAHRLNVLAAMFFPIATLSAVYTAIFSLFLAHGERHDWSSPALFYILLVACLPCGFLLARRIARPPAPMQPPTAKAKRKK
jgi:hypothetical protein